MITTASASHRSWGNTEPDGTMSNKSNTSYYTDKNGDDGDGDDDLLYRCFKHQGCGSCLDVEHCSWCPFTQSCIPNTYAIPALAPVYNENICPHWTERWEIRTRPLGCHVSTITALTGLISILSTLLFVGLVFLVVWVVRRGKDKNLTLRERCLAWWFARRVKLGWQGFKGGVGKLTGAVGLRGRQQRFGGNNFGGGDGGQDYEEGDGRLPVSEGPDIGEREPLLR